MSAGAVSTLKWVILLLGTYAVGAVIAYAARGRRGFGRYSAAVAMVIIPPIASGIITSRIVPGYEEDRWLVWWLSITIFGYAVAAFICLWSLVKLETSRAAAVDRRQPDGN